jgi:hypothetical protein
MTLRPKVIRRVTNHKKIIYGTIYLTVVGISLYLATDTRYFSLTRLTNKTSTCNEQRVCYM